MIDGLKPYSEYQTSPVPWLKRVPQHWRVLPVRRIGWVQGGKSLAVNAPGEMRPYLRVANVFDGFIDPRSLNTMPFTESEFRRFELKSGDVLLNEGQSLELVGRAAMYRGTPRDCAFQNSLIRVRPIERHTSADFLEVLFRHAQSSGIFAAIATQTTSIAHLGVDRLADLVVAVPPVEEQRAIVRFLDYADRRIRKYIAAKRKLIALLEEKKRAIIDRAVTRGLDPNVRLKDSGVPWIGMVPEHWEIERIAQLFEERVERGRPGLQVLTVSLRTGITVGADTDANGRPRKLISDVTGYKFTAQGDVVYNTMRMWQGAVGVSPCDGLVSPAYVVARPRAAIEGEYFSRLFRTESFLQEASQSSRGIVSDRNRLYWDEFRQIRCAVPPLAEQQQIVSMIRAAVRTIELALGSVAREVDLLRQYRARLISDVVTGKLDVRDAAAEGPDELEDVAEAALLDGVDDAAEEEDES